MLASSLSFNSSQLSNKTRIKRHPPSFLGITPKRLTCQLLVGGIDVGPKTQPRNTSFARLLSITEACLRANGQYALTDFSLVEIQIQEPKSKTITKTI